MSEGNFFDPFMHKRKSFEHEKELRAIIDKSPKKPLAIHDKMLSAPEYGIWKKVNLDKLIQKIFIAPSSPDYFRDLVEKVVLRYDLKKEVVQSSLDEEPFY